MQVKTSPAPAVHPNVQSQIDYLKTLAASVANGTAGTPVKKKANQVPYTGLFKYDGQYWIRFTGKGRKTFKDLMKVKNPCRAFSLSTGNIVALDNATVEHYPNATVSVA